MSDTEPQDGLPSTMPPPPDAAGRAVGLLDAKLDRVLAMLDMMWAAMQEDRADREDIRERLAALEAIPPPKRPTLLPPENGNHADG